MMIRVAGVALTLLLLGSELAVAQNGQSTAAPPLGLNNAEMTVKLLSPISTKTSQKGDKFSAQVIAPESYKDAVVEGHINEVKKAEKRDKSQISFAFETMTASDATHPIQADLKEITNSRGVKSVDEEGRAVGKTSVKKSVGAAAIGGGAGALLGGKLGGAKGAAIGAGAGAAAGLLFAINFTTDGSDMEFAPGSQFLLVVSDREKQ
jgi:hypothetical protein